MSREDYKKDTIINKAKLYIMYLYSLHYRGLTKVSGDLLLKTNFMFLVIILAAAFVDSRVQPAICGVNTKLSNRNNGSLGFAGSS